MIEVEQLIKRFGLKTVLRGMDFKVEAGEFVALIGPNGAGKTTFLRILASLTRPSMGSVRIGGHSLPDEASVVRRRMGFVSHMPLLYGDLTADENLRFFSQMYGIDNPRRIDDVLALTGLTRHRSNLVRTFSRGMQQRLAIGRAILHNPDVLLFDEPHTGLDQDACIMLDALLHDVVQSGQTVVMTSHDLARVEDLAGRFDVLSRGVIAGSTSKTALGKDNLLDFYRRVMAN